MRGGVADHTKVVDPGLQGVAGDDEHRTVRTEDGSGGGRPGRVRVDVVGCSHQADLEWATGPLQPGVGLAGLAAEGKGETAATLSALVAELDAARGDLARFAQGVHPRSLTEHGLSSALDELADQAAIPVVIEVPSRRFPAPQEAAAYFVCSEGLANVAKYAEASGARIGIDAAGQRLMVHVADDGRGGADPSRGSGLRGLADRVAALGGALSVDSPPGGGTRLTAELPIGAAS